MVKKFAELQRIDNHDEITAAKHFTFLYHLQIALLLALEEQNVLTTIQFRHAEKKLNYQRQLRAKTLQQNWTAE